MEGTTQSQKAFNSWGRGIVKWQEEPVRQRWLGGSGGPGFKQLRKLMLRKMKRLTHLAGPLMDFLMLFSLWPVSGRCPHLLSSVPPFR